MLAFLLVTGTSYALHKLARFVRTRAFLAHSEGLATLAYAMSLAIGTVIGTAVAIPMIEHMTFHLPNILVAAMITVFSVGIGEPVHILVERSAAAQWECERQMNRRN